VCVHPGERQRRAPAFGAATGGPLLITLHQRVQVAVALAIELRQALERKVRAGIRIQNRQVTLDELGRIVVSLCAIGGRPGAR
jgi:hypothetical protein